MNSLAFLLGMDDHSGELGYAFFFEGRPCGFCFDHAVCFVAIVVYLFVIYLFAVLFSFDVWDYLIHYQFYRLNRVFLSTGAGC